MDYPITPAVRFLRDKKVDFTPHLYDYVEKGGTRMSAGVFCVFVIGVFKSLVF